MPKLIVNLVVFPVRVRFTKGSRHLHRLVTAIGLSGRTVGDMLPIVSSLLSLARLGPSEPREYCLVCLRAVRPGDERVHVPGGGHVHSGCATYRMRQHTRTVRRIRSS